MIDRDDVRYGKQDCACRPCPQSTVHSAEWLSLVNNALVASSELFGVEDMPIRSHRDRIDRAACTPLAETRARVMVSEGQLLDASRAGPVMVIPYLAAIVMRYSTSTWSGRATSSRNPSSPAGVTATSSRARPDSTK